MSNTDRLCEDVSKVVSRMVKDQRLRLGLTQSDLAEKSGVCRMTIYLIEKGSQIPSLPNMIRLSANLNLSLDQIVLKLKKSWRKEPK